MAIYMRTQFADADGNKFSMSYPCVNTAVNPNLIKTFVQKCMATKEIFAQEPVTFVGAEFVVRSSMPIEIVI